MGAAVMDFVTPRLPVANADTLRGPYGDREVLPRDLIVPNEEPLISSSARSEYFYVPEIGYYSPLRHQVMVATIRKELKSDFQFPHGTSKTILDGCEGPLCRRYRRHIDATKRVYDARRRQIVKNRLGSSVEEELPWRNRSRKPRYIQSFHERMTSSAPQYAAVDPLIVLFIIEEYRKSSVRKLRGINEEWLKMATASPEEVKLFLQRDYKKKIDVA
jgi:hypothetical protein